MTAGATHYINVGSLTGGDTYYFQTLSVDAAQLDSSAVTTVVMPIAAEDQGVTLDYETCREIVYGMPYADWKALYQGEASAEQLDTFKRNKS